MATRRSLLAAWRKRKSAERVFRDVTFESKVDVARPEDVASLERLIGRRLPPDYREFLQTVNGGWSERSGFPIGRTSSALGDLYPLSNDAYGGGLANELEVFRGRVPPWGIPIGCDQGGNVLVMSLRDEDFGAVFFWDHEKEEEYVDAGGDGPLPRIAGSFSEFVDSLEGDEEDDATQPVAAKPTPSARKATKTSAPGARGRKATKKKVAAAGRKAAKKAASSAAGRKAVKKKATAAGGKTTKKRAASGRGSRAAKKK